MYTLRPYQKQASDAAVRAFTGKTKKNGLLILPTGAGKSLVIADIASKLDSPLLIFCPSKEILEQNFTKLKSYGVFDCGVYSASVGCKDINRITFATIGSVMNHMKDFQHFKYVMVDECHLCNARGGQYKTFFEAADRQVIGLTATPYRLGKGLNGTSMLKFLTRTRPRIFDEVLYYCQISELLAKGYLADLRYFDCTQLDMSNVHTNSTGNDFDENSLKLEYERSGFYDQLTSTTLRVLKPKNKIPRKGVLVFTRFTEEAERLTDKLQRKGIKSAIVTGETPKKEREAILEKFKDGTIKVVSNVGVLTTGFDYPALDTVILARPTKSLSLYYQMCLSMDTEVLTERGFLKYEEICETDKVAAYKDGIIIWTDIEEIVHRKTYPDEEFILFKNQHLDFKVTGYHELLVRSKWQKSYKKVYANDVAKMNNTIVVPVSGVQKTGGSGLKECELKFLGYFLSDGSLNKKNNQITIVQSFRYPHIIEDIESVLKECGMKYGKIIQKRKGVEAKYHDIVHFTISKGKPRFRDKDKNGWGYLGKYIDKNFGDIYENLDERDLSILLRTLNLGDGKKEEYGWRRKTYTIAMGNNKLYADRVQSLAVRRGWRCNMYTQKENGSVQYICYFKKQTYSTIAGQNVQPSKIKGTISERPKISIHKAESKDYVWCVKDRYGTIITRRNGKVLIMGNCGRAIRPFKDKDGWIIDLGGSFRSFGKVSDLRIDLEVQGSSRWCIKSLGKQLTNVSF